MKICKGDGHRRRCPAVGSGRPEGCPTVGSLFLCPLLLHQASQKHLLLPSSLPSDSCPSRGAWRSTDSTSPSIVHGCGQLEKEGKENGSLALWQVSQEPCSRRPLGPAVSGRSQDGRTDPVWGLPRLGEYQPGVFRPMQMMCQKGINSGKEFCAKGAWQVIPERAAGDPLRTWDSGRSAECGQWGMEQAACCPVGGRGR